MRARPTRSRPVRETTARTDLDDPSRPSPQPALVANSGRAVPELTARERQILDLLAAGLANGAIAAKLGVAVKTVANNVSAIFTKLQVADRSAAIIRARDAGLGR